MALTQAGRLLASDTNGMVEDLRTHEVLIKGGSANYKPSRFSGDGSRFARFSGAKLEVFDIATGQLSSSTPVVGEGVQLEIDQSGRRVIYSTRGAEPSAWIFNTDGQLSRGPFAKTVWVQISGNGKRGVTAADRGRLTIWNLETLQNESTVTDPKWFVTSALSPDGSLLAVLGSDNFVRIWDTHTSLLLAQLSNPGEKIPFKPDTKIVFSPDGTMIATVAKGIVHIHQIEPDALHRLTQALRGENVRLPQVLPTRGRRNF
jgi:WD40 repeat protein